MAKDIYGMTEQELRDRAAQNSQNWHTADDAGKAALHSENVDIYGLLDRLTGSTTDYDFRSGTWSTRPGTRPEGGGSFEYSRKNAYQRALDDALNIKPFSYDVLADPVYRQYAEQYRREGDRAMRDTYGQVAARTGGLGSSYATTAAQQANQVYLDRLNDIVPTLYSQAYDRYLQDYRNRLTGLEALGEDYAREYGIYQDALDRRTAAEREAYDRAQQEKASAQKQVDAILAAGGTPSETLLARAGYAGEYAGALAEAAGKEMAAERADRLAKYGDYSGLDAEGVDTAYLRAMRDAERADRLAKYGDYSGLAGEGINTMYLQALQDAELAKLGLLGGAGGGSGGGGGPRRSADPGTQESVMPDIEARRKDRPAQDEGQGTPEAGGLIAGMLDKWPDGVVYSQKDWNALAGSYDAQELADARLRNGTGRLSGGSGSKRTDRQYGSTGAGVEGKTKKTKTK